MVLSFDGTHISVIDLGKRKVCDYSGVDGCIIQGHGVDRVKNQVNMASDMNKLNIRSPWIPSIAKSMCIPITIFKQILRQHCRGDRLVRYQLWFMLRS